jgi:hypothetical protein
MKTKVLVFAMVLVMVSISAKAQYSVSVNYGNVDWIPKSNKVLVYENIFVFQNYSFGKTGLSVFQASCIAQSSNSYELGGLDYSKTFGKIKARAAVHGYFPKSSMFQYNGNGNLIPNIGISMYSVTVNTYQFWDYGLSEQYIISNVLYKKSLGFGSVEVGQYYNFKNNALSGSVAAAHSWQIYKRLSGFASIRWSFNESKTKLNDGNSIIVNIGLKI